MGRFGSFFVIFKQNRSNRGAVTAQSVCSFKHFEPKDQIVVGKKMTVIWRITTY